MVTPVTKADRSSFNSQHTLPRAEKVIGKKMTGTKLDEIASVAQRFTVDNPAERVVRGRRETGSGVR
jgi:hypothetical protein